jgi:hypothetical protein
VWSDLDEGGSCSLNLFAGEHAQYGTEGSADEPKCSVKPVDNASGNHAELGMQSDAGRNETLEEDFILSSYLDAESKVLGSGSEGAEGPQLRLESSRLAPHR